MFHRWEIFRKNWGLPSPWQPSWRSFGLLFSVGALSAYSAHVLRVRDGGNKGAGMELPVKCLSKAGKTRHMGQVHDKSSEQLVGMVIPGFGRLGPRDHRFKASLDYVERPCLQSQTKKNHRN